MAIEKTEDTMEQKRVKWNSERTKEREDTIAKTKIEVEVALTKVKMEMEDVIANTKKEGEVAISKAKKEVEDAYKIDRLE